MPTTTLTIAELDQITAILSATLRLTIIPGNQWIADRLSRHLMYPRDQIGQMPADEATGHLWRCVMHAVESWGSLDAYDVAVDAALEAGAILGVRSVHPQWILGVMLAAERERVEAIARHHARNLGNSFLPVRWQGWRGDEERADRALLAEPPTTNPKRYWERVATAVACLAAGAIDPPALPHDMTWDQAVVDRVRSLPTLPSYDAVLETIESLVPALARAQLVALSSPSQDDEARTDSGEDDENGDTDNDTNASQADSNEDGSPRTGSAEPGGEQTDETDGNGPASSSADRDDDTNPTADTENDGGDDPSDRNDAGSTNKSKGDQSEDGDPNGGSSASNDDSADENSNDKSTSGSNQPDGRGDDKDSGAERTRTPKGSETLDEAPIGLTDEIIDALNEAIERERSARTAIDFFDGSADVDLDTTAKHHVPSATWERHRLPETHGPAWAAVSRHNAAMREPLRRVFLELAENERGEWERHLSRGYLDHPRAMREHPDPRPFKRRSAPDERSYAFGLILDHSGSMAAGIDLATPPEVFGMTAPQRWHLTAQIAVALAEAIERLPEAGLTITSYATDVNVLKTQRAPLTATLRQTIMDRCLPDDDNSDAEAIVATVANLLTSHADARFILHLTDGQFCSSADAMARAITNAQRHHIEITFLTLACEPAFAQHYVPAHLAERVDPETLTSVVRKHLRRMVLVA